MTDYTVRVEFLSDWHIGTGTGHQGLLDRVIQRDADGLPYVPAKSLWGVWRDACEQVALGLDGGTGESVAWSSLVTWAFGDQPASSSQPSAVPPCPAHMTLSAAHFVGEAREFLGQPQIRDHVGVIRAGVAIDDDLGTARPDHLRMIELAPVGATLESTLRSDGDLSEEVMALLVAGASQIERIGGKRRRGAGRCKVVVEGHGRDEAVRVLRAIESPPLPTNDRLKPLSVARTQPLADTTARPGLAEQMVAVEIRVTALSPVLLGDATIGNVTHSRGRIPGAMLLAALQRHCDQPLWPLLERRSLSIGEGHLAAPDGAVSVPAPASLAVRRASGATDHDADTVVDLFGRDSGAVRRLPRDAAVTSTARGACRVVEAGTSLHVHSSVQDDRQRPTSETGGLYFYEAHDPGTTWVASVVMTPEAADVIGSALDGLGGEARLGASTKDDYGRVRIRVEQSVPLESGEVGSRPAPEDSLVSVLLTSDALLEDPALRPDPTPQRFVATLNAALRGTGSGEVTLVGSHSTTRRRSSWNSRWSLPRPTLVGLAAGSVVLVELPPGGDVSALARLGATGVGLRAGEGFGRFQVAPELLSTSIGQQIVRALPADADADAVIGSDPPSLVLPTDKKLRKMCVAAGTRALLDQVRSVADDSKSLPGVPDFAGLFNTQKGALRAPLVGDDWRSQLQRWLKGLDSNESRQRDWPPATRKWLSAVATTPLELFDRIGLGEWPEPIRQSAADRAAPLFLGELLHIDHRLGGDS